MIYLMDHINLVTCLKSLEYLEREYTCNYFYSLHHYCLKQTFKIKSKITYWGGKTNNDSPRSFPMDQGARLYSACLLKKHTNCLIIRSAGDIV